MTYDQAWLDQHIARGEREGWRGTGAQGVISSVASTGNKAKSAKAKVAISRPNHSPDAGKMVTLADLIRPPLATRPLKPEEQLSHDVAWMLHAMAKQGRLRALPICSSTEHRGGGQRAMLAQMAKQVLGAWKGQPDYVFVGPYFGVLELKRPRQGKTSKGQLTDAQRDCEAVCRSMGIPHVVAHSVEEARRALEEMGVIEGGI